MPVKRNVFGDYSRGADTTIHAIRMTFWSLFFVILAGFTVAVSGACWLAWVKTTPLERYVAARWGYAWFLHDVLRNRQAPIRFDVDGKTYVYNAEYVATEPWFRQRRDAVLEALQDGLTKGGVAGGLFVVSAVAWFTQRGRKLREEKLIRGGQIIKARQLAKLLRKRRQASDICLGEAPLVSGTETQHILVSGSGGTGKTQLKCSVLEAVRARGDAAIVYDSTGDYVRSFYCEGDTILCPVDARSPAWTPWVEIRHPADALRIATSIVPSPRGNADPYWSIAAQRLLAGALLSLADKPERNISQLLQLLGDPSIEALASAMKGLPIAAIFSGAQDAENRFANSVRGTLLPYVESLQFLPSVSSAADEFSLRGWVESIDQRRGPKPWIFLLSRADCHESLKPLISCWLDSLAAALMSLPPDRVRRLWFVVDEFPSLQRLPSIPKLLAEARKFGAACMLGIQGIPQLRAVYGHDEAEAIAGLCNTHVIFRTNSPDTAQWASRLLGEREVEEARESLTYSANDTRDGVHLSGQRYTRPIVLATEVAQLETLNFFVKLAGNYPITKTKIAPKNRPDVVPPYVEADISKTAWASFRPSTVVATTDAPVIEPISFDPTNPT